jgi:hypothetical protein
MENGQSTTEGEPVHPTAQLPNDPGRGGAQSWKQFDKRNTQGGS